MYTVLSFPLSYFLFSLWNSTFLKIIIIIIMFKFFLFFNFSLYEQIEYSIGLVKMFSVIFCTALYIKQIHKLNLSLISAAQIKFILLGYIHWKNISYIPLWVFLPCDEPLRIRAWLASETSLNVEVVGEVAMRRPELHSWTTD